MTPAMHPALCAEKLCMHFGGLKAVSDLDLSVLDRSIFGIIGPNGAGKTTVFNMLTGAVSYTHLVVYKRQQQFWLPWWGAQSVAS